MKLQFFNRHFVDGFRSAFDLTGKRYFNDLDAGSSSMTEVSRLIAETERKFADSLETRLQKFWRKRSKFLKDRFASAK